MKKSLLLVSGEKSGGGQERQLALLLNSLRKADFEVEVYISNNFIKGFSKNAILRFLLRIFQKIKLFCIILFSRKDVCFSMTFYLNGIVCLAAKLSGKVGYGSIRNNLNVMRSEMNLFNFYFNYIVPKVLISNSVNFSAGFNSYIPKNTVRFVNNFLNLEDSSQYSKPPVKVIRTLSIGRLFPVKNVRFIIEVIKELNERGYNVSHTHFGKGPLLLDLLNEINKYDLTEVFVINSYENFSSKLMNNVDVFLHAAYHEGQANVILEAMSCGLPVISSNCGDVSLLIRDDYNGFIYYEYNVSNVADLVEKCLKSENYLEMRRNARRFVEENNSEQVILNNYLKALGLKEIN